MRPGWAQWFSTTGTNTQGSGSVTTAKLIEWFTSLGHTVKDIEVATGWTPFEEAEVPDPKDQLYEMLSELTGIAKAAVKQAVEEAVEEIAEDRK